jgi:hypothetical protein
MNSNLLPSYTTEKYYLLSEIEDRAIFEAVEKDAGKKSFDVIVITIFINFQLCFQLPAFKKD